MLNNNFLSTTNIYNNKYFFIICFYIRKKNIINISTSLFIGYKFKYLFLNINLFIKTLKQILLLIQKITFQKGKIIILPTSNKLINYLLYTNCKQTNKIYYPKFQHKEANLINYLAYFPDLIISFDYLLNAPFLNKMSQYNVPIICITDLVTKNIILNSMYFLIINIKSFYSYFFLIFIIFNTIKISNIDLFFHKMSINKFKKK